MIDSAVAAFVQEGIGIQIGTRNASLAPSGARATAVVVEPGGTHVVVFVPKVSAPHVLPNLRDNGQAAIVFVRPVDERSLQIKGTFVDARNATAKERRIVEAQWEGFMKQVEMIGIPRAIFADWFIWPSLALRIKTTTVFDQTPGPNAGKALP